MRIVCAAIGRAKAGPERDLAEAYLARARAAGRVLGVRGVELVELDESRARSSGERRGIEAQALLAQVPAGAVLVALDETGASLASTQFAALVGQWRDAGRGACVFAIGGPDGHGPEIAARADLILSLGAMTWPHLLARVLVAEQIYRAVTILSGHPYHRA